MDDLPGGWQTGRVERSEEERGRSSRGGASQSSQRFEPIDQFQQGEEKKEEKEGEEKGKREKRKKEGGKDCTGEEGGSLSWRSEAERKNASSGCVWGDWFGSRPGHSKKFSKIGQEESWKNQEEGFQQSFKLQQQLQSLLKPREHLSGDAKGQSSREEMSRSVGLPSRGGDEGPPHHGLGLDVVSGDKWCHSSLDPSLLQDSFEGQDVGRNLSGSYDRRVAEAMDVGLQRLKSLELTSNGGDFRVSQRIELLPQETEAVASHLERREAIQEVKEEMKLRNQGGKGGDWWKADSWKGDKG